MCLYLLSFLDPRSIAQCMRVSKRWHDICSEELYVFFWFVGLRKLSNDVSYYGFLLNANLFAYFLGFFSLFRIWQRIYLEEYEERPRPGDVVCW